MVQLPRRIRSCDEGGLLEVGALPVKAKVGGCRRIELGGIGDEVVEVFVQEGVVGFDAGLPLMASVMER